MPTSGSTWALGGADRLWPVTVESPRLLEGSPAKDTELEKLEAEALKLAPGERAALVQRLLASLEEDTEMEEAWAQEVERRIAEVESGAVQLIPIEEASPAFVLHSGSTGCYRSGWRNST